MPGGAAGLQNQSGGRKVPGGFDSLPSPPRRQLVMIAGLGRPKLAGPKRRKDCRSFAEINSFRIQFFPSPRSADFAELFERGFEVFDDFLR